MNMSNLAAISHVLVNGCVNLGAISNGIYDIRTKILYNCCFVTNMLCSFCNSVFAYPRRLLNIIGGNIYLPPTPSALDLQPTLPRLLYLLTNPSDTF